MSTATQTLTPRQITSGFNVTDAMTDATKYQETADHITTLNTTKYQDIYDHTVPDTTKYDEGPSYTTTDTNNKDQGISDETITDTTKYQVTSGIADMASSRYQESSSHTTIPFYQSTPAISTADNACNYEYVHITGKFDNVHIISISHIPDTCMLAPRVICFED